MTPARGAVAARAPGAPRRPRRLADDGIPPAPLAWRHGHGPTVELRRAGRVGAARRRQLPLARSGRRWRPQRTRARHSAARDNGGRDVAWRSLAAARAETAGDRAD